VLDRKQLQAFSLAAQELGADAVGDNVGRQGGTSSNGFETSSGWPVSRQACSIRAAVFIASPRYVISRLKPPISPTTSEPKCRPARKSGATPYPCRTSAARCHRVLARRYGNAGYWGVSVDILFCARRYGDQTRGSSKIVSCLWHPIPRLQRW
jgi:hypothetical protein